MDAAKITHMLSYIAEIKETQIITHSKMDTKAIKRFFQSKYPLTETQIKYIIKILE